MACVLCNARVQEKSRVAYEDDLVFVLTNHFVYRDPHMMVLPVRCASNLSDLNPQESHALLHMTDRVLHAVEALTEDGVRVYTNGQSFRTQPQHLHLHFLPAKYGLHESYERLEGIKPKIVKSDALIDAVTQRVREKLNNLPKT